MSLDNMSGDAHLDDQIEAMTTAAMVGNVDGLQSMIDSKVDVNQFDTSGYTALMWAANDGKTGTLKLLLDADADLNLQTHNPAKYTAIILAVQGGHLDCVKLLVDANADLSITDEVPQTPLDWAKSGDHKDIVAVLEAAGAPVTERKTSYISSSDDDDNLLQEQQRREEQKEQQQQQQPEDAQEEQVLLPPLVRTLVDRSRNRIRENLDGYGARTVGLGIGTAVPTTPDATMRVSNLHPLETDSRASTPMTGDSLLVRPRTQRVLSASRSSFEQRVQAYSAAHQSAYAFHHGRSFVGVETLFEGNSYMSYAMKRNDQLGGSALIFLCYADIFMPPNEFGHPSATMDFAALCHPNSTMKFTQWAWFCNDFDIYPRLLSRAELVHSFRQSCKTRPDYSGSLNTTYHLDFQTEVPTVSEDNGSLSASIRSSNAVLQMESKMVDCLTYPQFIMALGRAAVLAYSKERHNSDDLMPKKDKVALLAEHLNLRRPEEVKLKLKEKEKLFAYRQKMHFTDTVAFASFSGVILSNANTHYYTESTAHITKPVPHVRLSSHDLVPVTRADKVSFPEIWKHYMGSFLDLGNLIIRDDISTRHKYKIIITNSYQRTVHLQLDFSDVPFLRATYSARRLVLAAGMQLEITLSVLEHTLLQPGDRTGNIEILATADGRSEIGHIPVYVSFVPGDHPAAHPAAHEVVKAPSGNHPTNTQRMMIRSESHKLFKRVAA